MLKQKNILITGVTGFIGKHLAKKLQRLDANVFGISRSHRGKNTYMLDICNYSDLEKFIIEHKISICFHLAGESIVEKGQKEPYATFSTNITGTLNILEIARKHSLERVIITSSSHIYGDNNVPYLESYFPRPSRPYETSKTCTDLIAQSYATSFNLPVLIPRFVNIYGPGDKNFTRLIPKTIKAIFLNEPVTMWGGKAVRDYLYISDAVNAFLQLATVDMNNIKENNIVNFGGDNIISVEELIHMIVRLSGKKKRITIIRHQRPYELRKQFVSFAKANKSLLWEPQISLEEGIKKTITWYEAYFSRNVAV